MSAFSRKILLIITSSLLFFNGCGQSLYNYAKKSERGSAQLIEKSIRIDNHTITYLEGGKGESILLIHGYAADKDNWTRFSSKLTDKYHVIAIDLPGFGESSRIKSENYNIENQTERVFKFSKTIGLSKFHIAGNSMGGWISGFFTIKHPEMVTSLTLINAAGVISPQKSELTKNLENGYNPLLVTDLKDYDRLLRFIFVKPPYIPDSIKKEFARKAVENRPFNEKVWADFTLKPVTLEPELKKIVKPALIIWGDKDRVLDVSGAEVFMKGIKGSKKYILKDCGHAPMIERPDETAEVFLKFLRNETITN